MKLLTAEVFVSGGKVFTQRSPFQSGAQEIGKPIVLFIDVQRGLDRGSEASPSDARNVLPLVPCYRSPTCSFAQNSLIIKKAVHRSWQTGGRPWVRAFCDGGTNQLPIESFRAKHKQDSFQAL